MNENNFENIDELELNENEENNLNDFSSENVIEKENETNILNSSENTYDNSMQLDNNEQEKESFNKSELPKEQQITNMPKVELLPNEIGRVKDVSGEKVIIDITSDLAFSKNLIDQHVVFESNDNKKIVGVLTSLNSLVATANLIGEIYGSKFITGVLTKPNIGSVCLLASEDEVKKIVVDDQNNVLKKVLIGSMPLYNNTLAYVPTNTFFSNHFAIFGNTGSGKSCGVARLLQNVFFNQEQAPKNACMFIFDAYGEYESALSVANSQIFFKRYSTNVRTDLNNLIRIPLWLLDIDDFALLLEANDATQLPIIEKALRLVTVFSGPEEDTKIYKNDIIARAILEVLYSGGAASQIHDQIFAILTSFNTPELNLETPIVQPGYTRSLRQCLIIDKEGKIGEIQLVSEFIKRFINYDLKLELPDGTIPFTL